MSNRQARRDQMRNSRQQRATQQRPAGRPSRPGGSPSRKGGGGIFSSLLNQRFFLLVSGLIVVLAVVLGVIIANQSTSDGGATDALTTARTDLPRELQKGLKIGKDDAPIKLAAFEDFQCPFCLKYTSQQEPTLIAEYVKSGKVQIEFKHLPILGQESVRAARASECMGQQDKFWEFHNTLFQAQAKAGQLTGEKIDVGRFSDDKLREFAAANGADIEKYNTCFSGEASLVAVQESQRLAQSLGFRSTPSFTLNGRPMGSGTPSNLDGWRTILDDAIKTVQSATPTATGSATATASASATATPAAATPTPTKAP